MIESSELKLNNWVQYQGKPYQIECLSLDFPFLNTDKFGHGVVRYEDLQPIEINHEWLLKLGFEKHFTFLGIANYRIPNTRFFCALFGYVVKCGISPKLNPLIYNHVHRLQNLISELDL